MDELERLERVLTDAGKSTELISCHSGRILVLPYGGRVLGLAPTGYGRNLFWTNPALADARSARAFYAGTSWHNSGGARTWIAPEVDFFFPQFPSMEEYAQPREIDPGNYLGRRSGESVTLVNEFPLRSFRTGETVRLSITKAITPVRLSEYAADLGTGVQFAGFRQETSLELLSPAVSRTRVALWDLLQLPHGGDLLIPTRFRSTPRAWFGEVPAGDLEVSEDLVRYRMRATGGQKIGVKADAVKGEMMYRFATETDSVLVLRRFGVDPRGDYIDVPWHDPEDGGYAVQACNVDNEHGTFSEMEHHAPAVHSGRGSDVFEVWAFTGAASSIDRIEKRVFACQM